MLFPHTITNIKDYKLWLDSQIKAGVLSVMAELNRLADGPDVPATTQRENAVRVAIRAIRRQREMERVYAPMGVDVRQDV